MKIVIILDAGFEFIGAFTSYYNAAMTKKEMEKTTDQFILPLTLKEIELDALINHKLRDWVVGTIRNDTGHFTETLEGKEYSDFDKDYTSHLAFNKQYIEVKSYKGPVHLRETLKNLRELFLATGQIEKETKP